VAFSFHKITGVQTILRVSSWRVQFGEKCELVSDVGIFFLTATHPGVIAFNTTFNTFYWIQ